MINRDYLHTYFLCVTSSHISTFLPHQNVMFDTSIITKYQHIQGFKEREREREAHNYTKLKANLQKNHLKQN